VTALFCVLCADTSHGSSRHILNDIDEVEIRRGLSTFHRDEAARQLILEVADRFLSSRHARLVRRGGTFSLEDLGSKNGVLCNGSLVERTVLNDGDFIEMGRSYFLFRSGQPAVETPRDVTSDMLPQRPAGLTTLSLRLEARLAPLEATARSALPVLILGESGTGKELMARAVHSLSGRPGPFIAINCAALPRALVESELFGFKKGSFSGALQDKVGLVTASDSGTLFLDEIGDMPYETQAVLLRVLQEREVLPIGATKPQTVDLRVIAASNRDLDAAVARNAFRADLRARLSGLTFILPPLRDRREDAGLLVRALLDRLAPGSQRTLSRSAARTLFTYAWGGNIRELEHALGIALVTATTDSLDLAVGSDAVVPGGHDTSVAKRRLAKDVVLRERLHDLLQQYGGNVTRVASHLGTAREQVYRWIKRVGLNLDSYRP
jgi:sigma-54 dependent transcriptional regulator, acetoin dehydrogenase operon transcriptional activator AcoR